MATYYVDSNATGLNDGSSWTNAWTSLASSNGSATTAGDVVYVASDHSETTTTNLSWSGGSETNPIQIINVDKTTNQYTTSSQATYYKTGGFYIGGIGIRVFGIRFESNTSVITTATDFIYTDCYFDIGYDSGSKGFQGALTGNTGKLISCTIRTQRGSVVAFGGNSRVIFENCTMFSQRIAASTVTIISNGASNNWRLGSTAEFRSCNLSDFDYLYGGNSSWKHQLDVVLSNCEFPSSYSYQPSDTISPRRVLVSACSGGTTYPNINIDSAFYNVRGYAKGVTSHYRSGGASIDSTGYSWSMQSNANAVESLAAAESLPITKYVEAASQTIILYLAGSSSLNDDDFWIEVESPSEESSATAQKKFRTTKPNPLATPTALTSDTSTWTGTGVGTVQKIEVPISPTIAGTVTVRCYLAKPSTTVYVDPKLSGTGYQRVYNGVLVDDNETITTTTSTTGTQIYPFRQFVSDKFGAVLHPLRSN
jgi:hypothetical protein